MISGIFSTSSSLSSLTENDKTLFLLPALFEQHSSGRHYRGKKLSLGCQTFRNNTRNRRTRCRSYKNCKRPIFELPWLLYRHSDSRTGPGMVLFYSERCPDQSGIGKGRVKPKYYKKIKVTSHLPFIRSENRLFCSTKSSIFNKMRLLWEDWVAIIKWRFRVQNISVKLEKAQLSSVFILFFPINL